MLTAFQEEYQKKLIASGISPDDAFLVASRTTDPQEKTSIAAASPAKKTRAKKAAIVAAPSPYVGEPETSSPPASEGFLRLAQTQLPGAPAEPAASDPVAPPAHARTAEDLTRIHAGEQLSLFDLARWGDDQRGLPNDFARIAIFSARNHRTPREYFMRTPLFSLQRDVTLTATGHELRVDDDQKVFNQLCEIGKHHPAGEDFEFRFGSFCKELGWPSSGQSYKRLTDSLIRLQTFAIHLETPRLGGKLVSVNLAGRLTVHERENRRRTYGTISVPRDILLLFAGNHFSRQSWKSILELKPTSRRLFDYAISHRSPNPLPMRSFARLAFLNGYTDTRLRQLCRQMCADLVERGLVESAWLDEKDSIRLIRSNK